MDTFFLPTANTPRLIELLTFLVPPSKSGGWEKFYAEPRDTTWKPTWDGVVFSSRPDNIAPWRSRDPQEMWEALATLGLIPASWADDPARRFVPRCVDYMHPGESVCRDCGYGPYYNTPSHIRSHPAVHEMHAVAMDPGRMLAAEAHVKTMQVMLGLPAMPVRWRVFDRSSLLAYAERTVADGPRGEERGAIAAQADMIRNVAVRAIRLAADETIEDVERVIARFLYSESRLPADAHAERTVIALIELGCPLLEMHQYNGPMLALPDVP